MTEINGADIEAVDVITFGSPCQDLSVAGKRAGLKHSATGDDETTRSGLFMEAVRIIKEMRRATNGEYPKLICWENVPGAFSSNSGEDFRTVLEELIKIVEPEAPEIPSPGKAGWPYADCIVGDGWSLAWRVFDAQYWPGTPQRRRRIYLVLDLTGECAEKVLFERPGLRGNSTESGTPGEATAGDPQSGIGADDPESGVKAAGWPLGFRPENVRVYDETATTICNGTRPGFCNGVIAVATQQGGAEISEDGICPTVTAAAGMSGNNQPWICKPAAFGISSYDSNSMKSSNPHSGIYEADTSRTLDLNGGNPTCNQGGIAIVEEAPPAYGVTCKGNGDSFVSEERHTALTVGGGQPGQGYPCVMHPVAFTQNQRDELRDLGDKAGALQAEPGMKQQTFIIDNIGGQAEYGKESQVNGTLRAGAQGAIAYCFDARGNGDGEITNTITGDHNNRVTDYSSVVVFDGSNITNPINAANPHPGDPCHTLSTDSRNYLTYCLQGNGIDRADTAGCNGKGWTEDVCYTLNTIDRPAVAYGFMRQLGGVEAQQEVSPTMLAAAGESGNNKPCVAYATDVGFFNTFENVSATMLARMYKDPHLVTYEEEPEYIVRRLTPTECARLQGFPDRWGDIPQKETLTDEEYHFWLKVRNTHAAINGREAKVYSKEQLLKWYNKLHSDSSEYKMWGNGIALPNALYVMQGIEDALRKKEK